VNEDGTGLLILVKHQRFDAHPEQTGLDSLPLPTLLLLAIVQFDLLHPRYKLEEIALVGRQGFKPPIIEHLSFSHEKKDPSGKQHTAEQKDEQYFQAVPPKYKAIYQENKNTKGHIHQTGCQKILDPAVVFDPLPEVTRHSGVKKIDRKFHQPDEKIGYQGDADPGADMEHYPTPDKTHRSLAHNQHQLGNQHQNDETKVMGSDPDIDDRLGKKGEEEAQEASGQKSQKQLDDQLPVWPKVLKQKPETMTGIRIVFFPEKTRSGFQEQNDSGWFSPDGSGCPVPQKFRFGVFIETCSRIGDRISFQPSLFFDLVKNHIMVLIPMQNHGQADLVQV